MSGFPKNTDERELMLLERYEPIVLRMPADIAAAYDKPYGEGFLVYYQWAVEHGIADTDERAGTNFRVKPVDLYVVKLRNRLVHDLLTGAPNPGLARFNDRSTPLWLTLNTLRRLGYTPGSIFRVVWDSPVGEKARQLGRCWLVNELRRVFAEPMPEPIQMPQPKRATP